MTEMADRVFCIYEGESSGEKAGEGRGEDAGRPENAGSILMRWPWMREARPSEPRGAISTMAMKLETAKEILAEIFHARPGEVER